MYFGRAVRIFPGLRAECIGTGSLTVGDDVSIGQGFHVIASGSVEIGEGALISANVFVTDTDHGFDNPDLPILRQPNVIRPTFIGRRCFLGVGARIQAGTQLGDGCVVGANAVVKGRSHRTRCLLAHRRVWSSIMTSSNRLGSGPGP